MVSLVIKYTNVLFTSGDNPVYVQSVKEHGAAWRAGLRAGDRILRVDSVPVHHHTHQQVVQMIRGNRSWW